LISGDGQIDISISEDGLIAWGTFRPPVADGKALTLDDVLFQLDQKGIVFGINKTQIQESLEQSLENHQILEEIPLAIGKTSVSEFPETWIFPPRIRRLNSIFHGDQGKVETGNLDQDRSSSTNAGQIDYRETHAWLIINKGQVIAKKRAAKTGEPGMTVKGEEIPFEKSEIKPLEPGKNVEVQEDIVIAEADGKFTWNDSSFWIDTQIEIAGDIDYKTGNIRFPGDLILKGAIKDRFKIWVGGDIVSSTTIDAYEILAKGSLRTPEGIIGRQKALIRVKGEIESKFIENCNIDCLSDLHIKNAILKSEIYTTGAVYLGDKGKVIGGELMAGSKLDTATLGNMAEMATPVQLGINYVIQRKVRYARSKIEEFTSRLARDVSRNQTLNSPKLEKRIQYLQSEIEKLNEEVDSLLEKIFFAEKPVLIVRGSVFPNVHIRLRDAELTIRTEAKAQRFELSEDETSVIQKSLRDTVEKEKLSTEEKEMPQSSKNTDKPKVSDAENGPDQTLENKSNSEPS
jgi:uncharacterized protein (DUF342 family)